MRGQDCTIVGARLTQCTACVEPELMERPGPGGRLRPGRLRRAAPARAWSCSRKSSPACPCPRLRAGSGLRTGRRGRCASRKRLRGHGRCTGWTAPPRCWPRPPSATRRHPGLRHRVQPAGGPAARRAPCPGTATTRCSATACCITWTDPQVLWDSVRRWAAPGAPVFVMDLRRAGQSPADARAPDGPLRRGRARRVAHTTFYHSLLRRLYPGGNPADNCATRASTTCVWRCRATAT
jgi:hypothetical protein